MTAAPLTCPPPILLLSCLYLRLHSLRDVYLCSRTFFARTPFFSAINNEPLGIPEVDDKKALIKALLDWVSSGQLYLDRSAMDSVINAAEPSYSYRN